MRAVALICLLLAQEPDVDALFKQLSDESIEVREKASAALIELGPAAEARLKKEAATAQGELKSRIDAVLFAIEHRRRLATVLPPLRRVTLDAKDRPLKDVLEEFKAKSGLSLVLAGSGEEPVTVRLRDALPIEALDAICRAAGVGYVFRGDQVKVVIEGKYAETPRAFAGRYAISAAGVSLSQSSDFEKTTEATTVVFGLFWPKEALPCAQPILDVTSATDDAGGSLMPEGKKSSPDHAVSSPELRSSLPLRLGARVRLKGPSEGAKKIASLKGRLKMSYCAAHFISFHDPDADQKLEYDGVSLYLKNFSHVGEEVKFNLDLAGRRRNAGVGESRWCQDGLMRIDGHKILVATDGGTELGPLAWSGGATDAGWRLNFTFREIKGKATAIRIEVDGAQFEEVVEFELKDIPFPK